MKRFHIAALTLLGWALIVTEPHPHTIKMGFQTREACEAAAADWRDNYKQRVKQANRTNYPRRRRFPKAIPPAKCVDETQAPAPPS